MRILFALLFSTPIISYSAIHFSSETDTPLSPDQQKAMAEYLIDQVFSPDPLTREYYLDRLSEFVAGWVYHFSGSRNFNSDNIDIVEPRLHNRILKVLLSKDESKKIFALKVLAHKRRMTQGIRIGYDEIYNDPMIHELLTNVLTNKNHSPKFITAAIDSIKYFPYNSKISGLLINIATDKSIPLSVRIRATWVLGNNIFSPNHTDSTWTYNTSSIKNPHFKPQDLKNKADNHKLFYISKKRLTQLQELVNIAANKTFPKELRITALLAARKKKKIIKPDQAIFPIYKKWYRAALELISDPNISAEYRSEVLKFVEYFRKFDELKFDYLNMQFIGALRSVLSTRNSTGDLLYGTHNYMALYKLTIKIMGDIQPTDSKIHKLLIDIIHEATFLNHKSGDVILLGRYAAIALKKIKPNDPYIHQQLIKAALSPVNASIRLEIIEVFNQIENISPIIKMKLKRQKIKESTRTSLIKIKNMCMNTF